MWHWAVEGMALIASVSGRPSLVASDVVFMFAPRESSLYEVYRGTVVGWAGRPRSRRPQDVRWFFRRVEEAHRRGLRYCAHVDFVVDFRGFIDFRPDRFMEAVCRDLDERPITVPWLWDHRYKGHPAYWFCTNNPDYRAFLFDQVERACLAPIDGLHIDDWRGTAACSAWFGGCFCPHCMEGFRKWLKRRFSPDQLRAMGIEDVENFDLRAFLKARGVTAEQWRRERRRLPFGELFQQFQTERMLELVREVFERAEALRGRPLLRSVNSSASSPEALVVAPLVDFFCGEMRHEAKSAKVPLEPAFVFRLVEGLGKRMAATATGWDWAWVAANEKPGLVRTWIAQAYAFGSLFMVPHRQWCYTPEKGTHWWEGRPEDFAFLYRFVREKAHLLDGYRSLSDLALVYTNADFPTIKRASLELLEGNVPFSIVVAEPELGATPRPEDLRPYKFIVVGEGGLPEGLEGTIKPAGGRIVRWQGLDSLPESVRRSVEVEGAERVRVSLRYKPSDPKAPLVCHLLNQDYDLERDGVRPARATIRLSLDLVLKALNMPPREAVLHSPGLPPRDIPLSVGAGAVRFVVEDLGLWAMVALR